MPLEAARVAEASALSGGDADELAERVVSFDAARIPLERMLAKLQPQDLGLSSADEAAERARAECMLALYYYHVEGVSSLPGSLAGLSKGGRDRLLKGAGGFSDNLMAKAAASLGRSILAASKESPLRKINLDFEKAFEREEEEKANEVELDTQLEKEAARERGLKFQRMILRKGAPVYVYTKLQEQE